MKDIDVGMIIRVVVGGMPEAAKVRRIGTRQRNGLLAWVAWTDRDIVPAECS